MDDVRIWNRARTAEEIYRDRYCRLTGAESNLVRLLQFRERRSHRPDRSRSRRHPVGERPDRADGGPGRGSRGVVRSGSAALHDQRPDARWRHRHAGPVSVQLPDELHRHPDGHARRRMDVPRLEGRREGTNPVTTLQMTRDKMVEARFGTPMTVAPLESGLPSLHSLIRTASRWHVGSSRGAAPSGKLLHRLVREHQRRPEPADARRERRESRRRRVVRVAARRPAGVDRHPDGFGRVPSRPAPTASRTARPSPSGPRRMRGRTSSGGVETPAGRTSRTSSR